MMKAMDAEKTTKMVKRVLVSWARSLILDFLFSETLPDIELLIGLQSYPMRITKKFSPGSETNHVPNFGNGGVGTSVRFFGTLIPSLYL